MLGFRIPFNAGSTGRRRSAGCSGETLHARHGHPELIYIDCGWRDQHHIRYGSRLLSQRLAGASVRHRYEEFDGHSDIDYRMVVSLPFLYGVLMR